MTRYHVKYYDAKLSRKGRGTQRVSFVSRDEAERFAEGRQLYGNPCVVEEVSVVPCYVTSVRRGSVSVRIAKGEIVAFEVFQGGVRAWGSDNLQSLPESVRAAVEERLAEPVTGTLWQETFQVAS